MSAPSVDSQNEEKDGGDRGRRPRRSFVRWLASTSRRTFFVYPVAIVAIEAALHGRDIGFVPWGLPLLAWGYLQYRLAGRYRMRLGGGGPGLDVPPEDIVATGPYRYLRNPMYLGHMIFIAGLAITFRSWAALALLVVTAVWFDRRVREDERRLEAQFGETYGDYRARVKRWIPWIL